MAPAIDPATGTLTYTPAVNAVGSATVFVLLHDDGGTANGGSDTSFLQTFTITINDATPTLAISGSSAINEGSSYTLGLSATDPDPIANWTINWGDGAVQTVSGNPSSVTHVFADGPNAYTISATATDEDGTFSAGNTVAVNVNNVTPTLTLSGAASANESSVYTLGLSSADPGQDTISSWSIAWGDGSTQIISGNPGSATHVYAAGNYTITASATDEDGTFSANNSVNVNVNAVHFGLTASPAATAGAAFGITVAALDPSGNPATNYLGTVHFTSSDALATLPADYTFGPSDAGSHVFASGVTLDAAGTQTLTAIDTVSGSIAGALAINVNPAAASRFIATTPATSTAGASITLGITALDPFNNVATSYSGTIHFTSSDPHAILPADTSLTGGVGSLSAIFTTAGAQSIVATDSASSALVGSSSVAVGAAAASQFAIAAPSNTTAGASFDVTVRALDPYENAASGYLGTIHFTSADAQAALPSDFTFAASDAGIHVFAAGVMLATAGTQTLIATDTTTATIAGSQSVNVGAAAASHYRLQSAAGTVAGSSYTITVTALDRFNNVATGYAGTVQFTSSDSQAVLPASSTLTNGVGTFIATLKSAGVQAMTAIDVGSPLLSGSQSNILVTPAAATSLSPAGFASPTVAGIAHSLSLTLRDAYGNVATGYTGTVHLSSSDGQAGLPSDYTFTGGDAGNHIFNITLKSAGTQSITATDAATGSLTGSQTNITVAPANAASMSVAGFGSPTTAGVARPIAVTVRDAFGNIATGYNGTLHFTSTDAQGSLPADYTFTVGDAGVHTFNATLKTAGTQSITATDTTTGSLAGSQTGIAVVSAAAASLSASGFASPTTAGVAHSITVTLRDAFGNVATGYIGTVRLSSSDAQAGLPGNYTFTAADVGTHTFSVILKTAATQTITVADPGNSALTSTQSGINVTAAAAASFSVASFPASTTAGVAQTFVVTARDAFGNVATSYNGTIHFSSSDGQAALPLDYTFTAADAGVRSFAAALKTAGARSITATDRSTSSITGTQTGIAVVAAAATHFAISAPANVNSQAAFAIVVTALDAFGNVATGYRGKIHFTSSDKHAGLPSDYTFTSGDAGARTFTVSLKSFGVQSITAKDTATSSISGTNNVIVH